MPETLLKIAREYDSEAEFREKNLPKYLLAKKKMLLRQAFPEQVVNPKNDIKGIYYLYKGNKVVYIAQSVNCLEAINTHTEDTMTFDSYRIFQPSSDSDRAVLALYLANKYRPRYNTNIGINELSFDIPNVSTILGKDIKGTICLKDY